MVCVIGLDIEKFQKLCDAANEDVEEDLQGSNDGNSLSIDCKVCLAVARAFHTRFMEPAISRLEATLSATEIRRPRIPFISNVDAQAHSSPDTIKKILARQVIFDSILSFLLFPYILSIEVATQFISVSHFDYILGNFPGSMENDSENSI
ncbi:hypothetical protein V2J09_016543 [Rumex salicifolius]